jgi:hypothetical protein
VAAHRQRRIRVAGDIPFKNAGVAAYSLASELTEEAWDAGLLTR